MPANRDHYSGSYARRAAQVRAAAEADPTTECEAINNGERCGRTLAEHKPGSTWQAGHVIAGQVDGVLRSEVNECNQHNGLLLGQLRKKLRGLPLETTQDW